MNPGRVVLWSLCGSLFILIVVFELIRHRRLREEYALLWLFFGGALLTFSVWRQGLDLLARILGVYYPPTALFLLFFIALFFILIHYSTVLSKLTEMNKNVVQELALLRFELKQMAARLEQGQDEKRQLRAEIERLQRMSPLSKETDDETRQ